MRIAKIKNCSNLWSFNFNQSEIKRFHSSMSVNFFSNDSVNFAFQDVFHYIVGSHHLVQLPILH